MNYSVEAWDPSYGTTFATEEDADGGRAKSDAEVVPDVEVPADQWRAVPPRKGQAHPATVLFVDGVRRIDARIWIRGQDDAGRGELGAGRLGAGGPGAGGFGVGDPGAGELGAGELGAGELGAGELGAGGFGAGGSSAGRLGAGGLGAGGLGDLGAESREPGALGTGEFGTRGLVAGEFGAGNLVAGEFEPGGLAARGEFGVRSLALSGYSGFDGAEDVAALGLCASYASGVVMSHRNSRGSTATVIASEVRRGLFTTALSAQDIAAPAGNYRAHVTDADPTTPLPVLLSALLQQRLSELEITTAVSAREKLDPSQQNEDLLVVDGPLRGRQHLPRTIGYIKTHHSRYLPPELNQLVARLEPGHRTPVFRMGTNWERYSWYLRLPYREGAPWAGIVRVECSADLIPAEAIELAHLSQAVLVRYASSEIKDPRAPQNLYPIAGLEKELRRRLGNPQILHRSLRTGRPR